MTENDVKKYINGLHDLSTIPVLVANIVRTCSNPDATPTEVYKLISTDPALGTRVLRVANSVFYGRSGQIKNLYQAIMFLGFERIKSLALGITVQNALSSPASQNMTNLWIHSYEVAYCSSILSPYFPMTVSGDCFIAGLLHDIGRIVFIGMSSSGFAKIRTTDSLFEQERSEFGCTHTMAGAWLIESLGMPADLLSAIQYHHDPSRARTARNVVAAVALAEAMTLTFKVRPEDDGIWTGELDAILEQFSLTEKVISEVGEKLNAARPEIESMFSSR
jgi:HD-like signal output (HDOD) protein